MKKILYILLLIGCISIPQANAQRSFFALEYSMGFGSGDIKNYITSSSFRGVSIEFRQMVTDNVGVGFETGWNVFYERRAYDTYTTGSTSLTGVQYRYVNAVPLLLATNYYFKPGEHINPFIGLGVGTIYSHRNTDMGLWTLSTEDWQFALRPELGVLITTNSNTDIILAAKYMGGFATSDQVAQSYFTFNIGFAFKNY